LTHFSQTFFKQLKTTKMKKLLLVLTILGTLLGAIEPAKAGWNTEKRNRCWPWSNKYVASAHLLWWRCGAGWDNNRNANCSGVSAYVGRYWGCCSKKSEAYAQSNGGGQWGWVSIQCSGVSGAPFSDLLADAELTAAAPAPGEEDESALNQDCNTNATFGPSEVVLDDLAITLSSAAGTTQNNTVTVAAWLPVDVAGASEEDTYDDSKAIAYGTVSLKDGILHITGSVFSADDFTVTTSTDGKIVATYVGGSKTIPIPASVDMEGVAVHTGGDIKEEEAGLMKKLMEAQSNGAATLKLYPNPATSGLQLSLEQSTASDVSIGIYDIAGKKVKALDVILQNGAADLKIDITTLPAGTYFVLVKGTDLKLVQQFTKQ
jgi:hypothetical protein